MANEIYVSTTLTVTKDGGTITGQQQGLLLTMDGQNRLSDVQNVGTSVQIIRNSDVNVVRYLHLKNIDSTNQITISISGSSIPFTTLQPGDVCLLSSPPQPLYAQAAGAQTALEVVMCEQ